MKFTKKENAVRRYFKSRCDLDGFVSAFSYMNCIEVEDYEEAPLYDIKKATNDDLMPLFRVTLSENDEYIVGGIIKWDSIDKYIEDLLENGSKDCIECVYGHIIKVNKRRK